MNTYYKVGGNKMSDEQALACYKYFKQASLGDCNIERPGGFNPFSADKYKWDAWNSVKGKRFFYILQGMSQDDAKVEYVKLAKSLLPEQVGANL